METAPGRRRPGQGEFEGLGYVVSVHVMQHTETVIGQCERRACRQCGPRGGVEVAGVMTG